MSFPRRRIKNEDLLKKSFSFIFIQLLSCLKRRGLKYFRWSPGVKKEERKETYFLCRGRQKSWQKFGVFKREIVRSICNEGGFKWKWLGDQTAAFKWEEIQFRAFAIRRGSRRLIRKRKFCFDFCQISVFRCFLFYR